MHRGWVKSRDKTALCKKHLDELDGRRLANIVRLPLESKSKNRETLAAQCPQSRPNLCKEPLALRDIDLLNLGKQREVDTHLLGYRTEGSHVWGRKLDFTVVAVLDATETPARLVGLWRWQGMGWEAQIEHVAQIIARFDPWAILGDGSGIGDALSERLQKAIRAVVLARDPNARVPPFEVFLFTGDSKQSLVDRLNLRLSARRLAYPAHRVLLGELRSFEYLGNAGPTGRTRTGARGSGHDDVVMALALAVYAAPESAPVALASQVLLGSSVGGMRRET